MHDPQVGRFLSADPLLDLADPMQANGYAYAHNNPVTLADATGLSVSLTASEMGAALAGVGLSPAQVAEAQAAAGRSLSSVILSAAWGILKEIVGLNDALNCFGGDLWACVTLLASAIPVSKLLKVNKIKKAVEATVSAVKAWKAAKAAAERVLAIARAAEQRALNAKKLAIERAKKAAQAAAKKPTEKVQTTSHAAAEVTRKTGNPVQKRAQAEAKPKASSSGKSGAGNRAKGGASGESKSGGSCSTDGNSFTPGTKVLMADGSSKPIEQVKPGDKVQATDPETGESRIETVTAAIRGEGVKNLVTVTIDTDGERGDRTATVTATDGHPFWVPELGAWLDADELKAGQWLRTGAGTHVQITAVDARTAPHGTVHNLTVGNLHTYYVLADIEPVLVHNCGLVETARAAAEDAPTDATMTAAARFRGTNMTETGYSGHSSRPQYLEQEIEDQLSNGGQTFAGEAANCAEVRACNNLIASHGAAFEERANRPLMLSDIEFITVRSLTGELMPACLSCQGVLVRPGATDLSR